MHFVADNLHAIGCDPGFRWRMPVGPSFQAEAAGVPRTNDLQPHALTFVQRGIAVRADAIDRVAFAVNEEEGQFLPLTSMASPWPGINSDNRATVTKAIFPPLPRLCSKLLKEMPRDRADMPLVRSSSTDERPVATAERPIYSLGPFYSIVPPSSRAVRTLCIGERAWIPAF